LISFFSQFLPNVLSFFPADLHFDISILNINISQALRNAASAFASTRWVLHADADFIPTVESRRVLQEAVRQRGFGSDGSQLKRAFIVAPFSTLQAFHSPLNFSFISANIGDDASNIINSWPEVPEHANDERQFQCHANIDLQRWLDSSQQLSSGTISVADAVYKVFCLQSCHCTCWSYACGLYRFPTAMRWSLITLSLLKAHLQSCVSPPTLCFHRSSTPAGTTSVFADGAVTSSRTRTNWHQDTLSFLLCHWQGSCTNRTCA
jgi:hypothetical protein